MTDVQPHLEQLAREPGSALALSAVETVFGGEGRWEELVRVYEDNALRAGAQLAGPLLRKAAFVCLRELSSPPRAEVYLRRALEAQPTDLESSRALRQIYLDRGEFERAVELHEKELARTADAKDKARGLVEVAHLYVAKLSRNDKAMSALRQAERADAKNPEIFTLAAQLYEAQGRLDQAHDALQKELAAGATPSVLDRLARLSERLLERPKLHELARAAAAAVLAASPGESRAARVKQELDAFKNAWSGKVLDLAARASKYDGAEREKAADDWLSVAEIQLIYGKQEEAALGSIDRALMARPGYAPALRLLEEIYAADDRFDELSLKLEMMAAHTREPETAVELYLKAAVHHAVRLDNPDGAAKIYQRVLSLDPGNKVASNALSEYYRERKQWQEALGILTVWAERSTVASDKVAAHYACSRIFEEELNDKLSARPHYEAILALDPENQAAARALEDVYRKNKEHPSLAKVLRAKLVGLAGDERLACLQELGDLYAGPLAEPAQALGTLGDLYQARPTAELRERLEELAARGGAFAALVQILEGGLERIESDDDRVQALHSLAALYEGARDAPLEALRIHRRILALSATDARARAAVDRLMEAAAAAGNKVDFYREQAQAASTDAERVQILHRLARELVDVAKDYVRAIDVYRQILKLQPTDADALEGLISLYRRDDRQAELAEVLEDKVRRLPAGPLRAPILLELGALYEEKLGQLERAVDAFIAALDAAEGNEAAVAALLRLLTRTTRVGLVAERLEPCFTKSGRHDMVAQMLEIRVREAVDPAARVTLLVALADIYEQRLKRPQEALATLLRAYQADPGNADVQPQLERLAAGVGDHKPVIRAYRSAARVLEGSARLAILMRAGSFAEREGDVQGALVDFLRALGHDEATDTAATDGLARLKTAGLTATRLREAAEQIALSLEEPVVTNLWRKLARFGEKIMNSPADAIAAWKAVLAAHNNDPEALAELDRLYQSSSDPATLAAHLRQKVEQAPDDVTRAALGGQLAEVLADRLSDLAGAVAELAKVAHAAPGQPLVWQRLTDLYLRQNQPAEAAQALHREINLLADGPERRGRLVVFAELLAKQLNDLNTAVAALQGVVTSEPAHPQALALLAEMLGHTVDPAQRDTIGKMLLAGYKAGGKWQESAELLALRADAATEAPERTGLLRELAGIKADKLGDAEGAYAALERAFRDAPLDAELRRQMEAIADKAGALARLVEAYSAALAAIPDADAQRPLRRKLAEALETLGRGAEALEHYKGAGGGALPDDLPSLESLERLLRTQNRPQELADVLWAIIQKLPADANDRKKTLTFDLGTLCATQIDDKGRAVEAFKSVVELDPRDLRAWRALEQLHAELNQLDELARALDKIVELAAAAPEVAEDYVKRAQVAIQLSHWDDAFKAYRAVLLKKRDHAGAIAGLEALIEQAPNKLDIAQVLEPLYTAKQDHAKLAWVLERKLDGTTDLTQRKGLLRRIGDIYENRLNQKDKAFAMARRSLGEDPADMGVRMWIEKLAGETGALKELALAYVDEAKKTEPKVALQFHRRAAAILHEKLSDLPSAVSEYQAILELEPKDEKAIAGLESIFRATEQPGELCEVLKKRLAMTAGLERKREYLTEIATIQAQKLTDLPAAVATYKEILALTPDDPAASDQVERLLAQAGQWQELATFYEGEIKRLSEKRGKDIVLRRLELSYRRGRVLDEQFQEHEAAAQILGAVLSEAPDHQNTLAYLAARAQQGMPEAYALLEKTFQARGMWKPYVDLLEQKLAFVPESDRRREIYLEISKAYDQHLKVGDMAFLALTRAFNENRADKELLATLETLAEKYGAWEELVAVIGVDLDAVADPLLRQHLLRRLGHICGQNLGDAQRAIAYLKQALSYEPGDQEALATLDALLEKHEMWAALAEVLERRIEVAAEPADKSKLLERLAGVWGDRLMDAEAALRCHKQILEIDPDHPLTLKSMQKLYAEVQDWDSLAKNLLRQAEVLTEPAEQVRIHAAAGSLFAEELNDNGQAILHWQKVVAIEPTHAAANQALEVLLSAEERWEELAQQYQRVLAHTKDATQKSEINRRLGVILGQKLGRSEDALSSWLEVVQTQPKNVDALRALSQLYAERAKWDDFVGMAKRLIPLVDPAEAKEVRLQLARALGEGLGKRDEAVKLAREVRATEPHTADQLRRLAEVLTAIEAYDEAVICLEKSAALEADVTVKVSRYFEAARVYKDKLAKPNDARGAYEQLLAASPQDNDAFTALAEIYRATAEWRKLVALNESFVPSADPATRLAILVEIRDVQDQKLGEKELAFIAACRVYKENPADITAAEVLERIGKETGGAEELVAVLEDEVDNIVDSEAKIGILRRIARVYAEALNDAPQAEATLNKILELSASDSQALDALSALGAKQERFDKQIQALELKLSHATEDVQRKAILFEIARIWEDRIGEVDEAINALQKALEIDGADTTVLDNLARIYEQSSRFAELAHTLTRKVELAQDAAENIALRMKVAALCEGELADSEAAIQWYRGVLDFDPGNAGALSSLERLYTSLERWSELVQIFEVQLGKATDNDEKIRLLSKMASIYENEFDSLKDAAACYERVGAVDATHLPSLKQLERLLRALGEWNRLIEVLQHHITLLQDQEEVTMLYLEVGEIYYKELSRVDKAEQIYQAARQLNPKSAAALSALGQLYERSGNWFQSLEMLSAEADALGNDAAALPVLLRIGRINEEMLMDLDAAKSAYQRALAIDPNYGPALAAMKEIAKSSSDWEAYAENLINQAETTDDKEEKADLFIEAARFFQDVRQDEPGALRYYERALEVVPAHPEASKQLAELYFRQEQWKEAGELYGIVIKQLDKAKDAKEYCQKSHRLGYISEKLGDKDAALAFYKQAYDADATYLPALEGLGQALLAKSQWEEAQKVFQSILIHHRDSLTESEVVDVQWQLGDICLRQNQPDRAYKQFERALEIDPDHGAALASLAKLDEAMENWEGAYARLSRLADVAPSNERVQVILELSSIATERLQDPGRAIEALERVRKMGHPPVELLEQLASVYMSSQQATRAAEVLEQAVAACTDKDKLSAICFTLGAVYEGELKHEPLAVQKYNDALDAAPKNVKAFEAIERILATRQEWALLEANYRAMIARAKELSPAVRLVLWRSLGDLYRRVLKNVDGAIMAYEVIQKLEPGKKEDAAILAELYAQKPENRKKAIAMQHDVLHTIDNPVAPIKTLRKAYHAERDFDAVYCLTAALTFLKEADEEEQKIFDYLSQGVPPKATGGLMPDHWKLVSHPGLLGPIAALSAWMVPSAPDILLFPAKDLGLKKKDQIDIRGSDLYFANLARYAGKLLGMSTFDAYKKSGSVEPLHLVNSQPPALVAGENHDVFRDAAQRVVLFHIGRNLAYMRPEMFLAGIFPLDVLRDVMVGLCVVYNPQLKHNGDPREVQRWAEAFGKLPPATLKRLQPAAQAAYPEIIKGKPLEDYAAAVEITAARAGFLAAGELAAAVRGITEGVPGASTLPARERVKQLVLFSVSKPYLELRKVIGAALVENKQAAAR